MIYDLIIIGAGPAGLTAAIYAARQKISFLIISKNVGGQTLLSSDVENYLGYHLVSGTELVKKFEEHIKDYKIDVKPEEVLDIKKKAGIIEVKTDKNLYQTKTALIASGKIPRPLNARGEKEFIGKGVTYCATCDAPLFKNKDVAVIGGGNSAMDAALLASKYSKKVYLVTINKELIGETSLIEDVKKNKKIAVIYNAKTTEIFGDKFVKGIKINVNGEEKIINVEGVFIEIGTIPSVSFDKITEKNNYNEIKIHQENWMTNLTSVRGIFAAGDVTDVPEKQIVVAAGEGCKAALSIFKYLSELEKKP